MDRTLRKIDGYFGKIFKFIIKQEKYRKKHPISDDEKQWWTAFHKLIKGLAN